MLPVSFGMARFVPSNSPVVDAPSASVLQQPQAADTVTFSGRLWTSRKKKEELRQRAKEQFEQKIASPEEQAYLESLHDLNPAVRTDILMNELEEAAKHGVAYPEAYDMLIAPVRKGFDADVLRTLQARLENSPVKLEDRDLKKLERKLASLDYPDLEQLCKQDEYFYQYVANDAKWVQHFLNAEMNPNLRINSLNRTLLHASWDVEAMKVLLDAGADPNARDDRGAVPLMRSGGNHQTDHYGMKKLLIDYGANVNISADNGFTPLHCANDAKDARLLIEHGANPYAKNDQGETPYQWLSIRSRSAAQVIREAMQQQARQHQRSSRQDTIRQILGRVLNPDNQ